MSQPVVVVQEGGKPVVSSTSGQPVLGVSSDAQPVRIVASDAQPVVFESGSILGANLVTNGNMELNSGWLGYNTEAGDTHNQSTGQVYEGTYSWFADVDNANEGFIQSVGSAFLVTSGKTYYCEAWVYIEALKAGATTVGFFRNSGILPLTQNGVGTIGAWQKISATVTATSTGGERVRFQSIGGGAEYYVDNVSVREVLVI